MAETVQWDQLLREALDDAEAAEEMRQGTAPKQGPAGEGAAALKRAQAAVSKARTGNLRGGLQVLTGEGVAEGTPETELATRQLVMEHPAAADGDGELERQLAEVEQALRR